MREFRGQRPGDKCQSQGQMPVRVHIFEEKKEVAYRKNSRKSGVICQSQESIFQDLPF